MQSRPVAVRVRWVKIKWVELPEPTWEREVSLPAPVLELPGGESVPEVMWAQVKGHTLTEFGGKAVEDLNLDERPSVERVLAWVWLREIPKKTKEEEAIEARAALAKKYGREPPPPPSSQAVAPAAPPKKPKKKAAAKIDKDTTTAK